MSAKGAEGGGDRAERKVEFFYSVDWSTDFYNVFYIYFFQVELESCRKDMEEKDSLLAEATNALGIYVDR